jgi:hypothetical protein
VLVVSATVLGGGGRQSDCYAPRAVLAAIVAHRCRVAPRVAALALCLPQLVGCAAEYSTGPKAPKPIDEPPPIQQLEPMTVAGYSSDELVAEFERAHRFLLAQRFKPAARAFDRLMRLAGDEEIVASSMFNSGVAHVGLADRATAQARFAELVRRFPEHRMVPAALLRSSRLLVSLERWGELETTAEMLLAMSERLVVMDRIEAHGAMALALVEQGRADAAQREVTHAVDLIEKHRFGQSGNPPAALAQVSFAQGEVRRLRSERIKLVPVPADFADVLERRCRGLLDAQSAYTEAMRSRHAHWSAMAGYRVGQLYQRLHAETLEIPPPATARSDEQKQLFHGAMRLRYRILLEKGLKMMSGTERLGERTGEGGRWVERARESRRSLEAALRREKEAIAALPHSEEQLRAARDALREQTATNKALRNRR